MSFIPTVGGITRWYKKSCRKRDWEFGKSEVIVSQSLRKSLNALLHPRRGSYKLRAEGE